MEITSPQGKLLNSEIIHIPTFISFHVETKTKTRGNHQLDN